MACIVIDIGNTSTSIGHYSDGEVSRVSAIRGGISNPIKVEAALRKAGAHKTDGAILASVVPAANANWQWMLKRLFNLAPHLLTHRTPLPIGIRYPRPERIGADRLANACAAAARYGAPAIVADFGTALTFDILSDDHHYIGGVIAPGLPLMTDYLHEKTALLPRVTLHGEIAPVGTTTEEAMRIGARIGYRGAVKEITSYLCASLGATPTLCATGGYAEWALQGVDMSFHIDPDLTLFGLGLIHDHILNE